MKKKVFSIGTGVFGEGKPKICVPIVEKTREEILKRAEEIAKLSIDVVEWRGDFYQDIEYRDKVLDTLRGIKQRIDKKALLFTFRTAGEGGEKELERENYYDLNEAVACGGADFIDIEAFLEEERTYREIERLHRTGVRVIASNHDFYKTPDVGEMVRRLKKMEDMGADVAKLAVMPVKKMDVIRLLEATVIAEEEMEIPVVTMSMGQMGVISRVSGGLTGAAMTFAAVGKASAPGQIAVEDMRKMLDVI